MDKIILYHGSENIIKCPKLELGKKNNDYGQGFYCTRDIELAKEWARKNNNKGYVNKYEVILDGLKVLDLQKAPFPILNWITLLLKNREFDKDLITNEVTELLINKFLIDLSLYDIVIGYRADDSYFSYAQSFLSNSISLKELSYAMKLGKLGVQYVLVSKKAFENIKWLSSEEVDEEYYYLFRSRDIKARKDFHSYLNSSKKTEDEIFAIDIIRNEVDENDPRLR